MAVGTSIPVEPEKFSLGLPICPRFVVTIITPLAPLAPKTAVAEASLSTEIVLISLGSRFEKSRSTPSTITNGLDPFQLDNPRIIISDLFDPG